MSVKCWKGSDVLVVGWIPFHLDPPPTAGFRPSLETKILFQSGNPAPPIAFPDFHGFADWLHPTNPIGTKEYRAALYLRDVKVEFPAGSPPRVWTANGSVIGYTPLRLFIGGVNVAGTLPQLAQYKKGIGPPSLPTAAQDPAGNGVEIRYRAEFKLSGLPNLLSRVFTGAWPPYAWCEIAYRLDEDGRIDISVEGSAIPTQRLYINWAKPIPAVGIVPEYDMLTANLAEVDGFIQTLNWGCRPAPGARRLNWQGQATAC